MGEVIVVWEEELPYTPQQIWQVVTDLMHWQWRSDLSACKIVDEQRFIEIPKNGQPIHFCTIRCEEPRIWEFQLNSPALTGTWRGTFTPKENGRSQVTFVEAVQLRHKLFPRWVAKRLLRAYQARYFRDLRAELQSQYG